MRPLVASIDLAALKYNFSIAQQAAPKSKNFAVIKADAYGHGAVQCAQALDQANGFAVASVEEAIELRKADIDKPILVLSAFSQVEEVEILHQYQIMPVIHSLFQLNILIQNHQAEAPINCWLKIDTGMNRLGLNARQFVKALELFDNTNTVNIVGVMSHLACADEKDSGFTHHQTGKFNLLTSKINTSLSLANSSGILAWPDTHKDWNRPGIMLYGASSLDSNINNIFNLKPVMHLNSGLIAVNSIKKGQGVGYGQIFTAETEMKIGIVACGYADGYPRHACTGTPVLISGQRTQTLGRVSMDSLAVDLTQLPQAQIGDQVTLWGENLPVNEIAKSADTITYELLSNVSKRVPRVYNN